MKSEDIIAIYNKINQYGKQNEMHFKIVAPGNVHYFMQVKASHLATPIAAHGGAIAGFMDAILGVTALSQSAQSGNLVSTVEFKIQYLHPVYLNNQLKAIGKVDHAGKRIIICSADIICQNRNIIVAKGSGTFNAYPFEKSGINIHSVND